MSDQLSEEDREKSNIILLYVLKELETDKSTAEIVQSLVQKGLPPEAATAFVQYAQRLDLASPRASRYLERSIRAKKYSARMKEGCGLLVLGALITGATYLFAEPGSGFIICYGAMAAGALYLLIGLIGWLANT